MNWSNLYGEQYVRLAPGAADRVAPYIAMSPEDVGELVIDLTCWPANVRTTPVRGRNGLLIAGDPLLLDASDRGLLFAAEAEHGVWVAWNDVRSVRVLGRTPEGVGR